MNTQFQNITINGKNFPRKQLLAHCKNKLSQPDTEWEKNMYAFILEWLNEKDYVVVQTSGSTGAPKKIEVNKLSMVNSARLTGGYFNLKKGQTALLCLSANYIAGKMMIVRSFVWGLNLIPVEPSGHPVVNLNYPIDFAAMVPLQLANSVEQPERLELIKNLIVGGGAVGKKLTSRLSGLKTRCFSTYGMTETLSHVALKTLNGPEKSNTFKALKNIRFATDGRGCLVIYAPYLANEKLVTNDMVNLLGEKEFEWLGRHDNVINSGGVKIMPEKLEKRIEHLIPTRFFFGKKKDDHLGESLVLIIEDYTWETGRVQELTAQINQLLAKYEQPKEILFLPQFAETASGKILRIVPD